jgi:hypothetical protein
MYLGLYQVGILFFPDSYLLGNEFQVNFTSNLVISTILLLCEEFPWHMSCLNLSLALQVTLCSVIN